MSTKDKLVKVSSLEETAKTIQANFPTVSGGGVSSHSLIAVSVVDVDTLNNKTGLLTFTCDEEVEENDQIVFDHDGSLYFCKIYSISSQQITSGTRYVVAVVEVLIVKEDGATDNSAIEELKKQLDNKADLSHNHVLSDLSGTLSVAQGGTGLTSSPSAITDLSTTSRGSIMTSQPSIGVTGILPVANGGTGTSSLNELASQLAQNPVLSDSKAVIIWDNVKGVNSKNSPGSSYTSTGAAFFGPNAGKGYSNSIGSCAGLCFRVDYPGLYKFSIKDFTPLEVTYANQPYKYNEICLFEVQSNNVHPNNSVFTNLSITNNHIQVALNINTDYQLGLYGAYVTSGTWKTVPYLTCTAELTTQPGQTKYLGKLSTTSDSIIIDNTITSCICFSGTGSYILELGSNVSNTTVGSSKITYTASTRTLKLYSSTSYPVYVIGLAS